MWQNKTQVQVRRTNGVPLGSFSEYIEQEYDDIENLLHQGEPLLFDNGGFTDEFDNGASGLFVGAYRGNPSTSLSSAIYPMFVGPYHGSDGIYVENFYNEPNLGEISLKFTSSDNSVNIAPLNGYLNFTTNAGSGGSFSGSVYGSNTMILGGYLLDNTHTLDNGSSTSLQSTDFKLAYKGTLTFKTYALPSDLPSGFIYHMDLLTTGIETDDSYKHEGAYAFWDKGAHHILAGYAPKFDDHTGPFANSLFHKFPELTGLVVQSNMLTNVVNSYQITPSSSGKYYAVVYHDDTFNANTNATPKLAVCIPNSYSSGNSNIFQATSRSYNTSDNRDGAYTTVKYMVELSSDVLFYVDETPTWKSEWYLSNNTGNTINVSYDFVNIDVKRIAVFGGNRPADGVVTVPVEDGKMVKVALFIENMRVNANETMKTAVIEVSTASSYSTVSTSN